MFLWMTPIPPARAIAIAMSDSVTVSMAADANGTFSEIPRVNSDDVLTSFGCTRECRGLSKTSSKVRTMSARTRDCWGSADGGPLMRESPLPASAGLAGLFDVDGRVVVAIAKCMGLCGLRPEVGNTHRASGPSQRKRARCQTPAAFYMSIFSNYGNTGAGACSCC